MRQTNFIKIKRKKKAAGGKKGGKKGGLATIASHGQQLGNGCKKGGKKGGKNGSNAGKANGGKKGGKAKTKPTCKVAGCSHPTTCKKRAKRCLCSMYGLDEVQRSEKNKSRKPWTRSSHK